MNISVVCSMGLGTSFIIKINLESLLKQYNIKANVNHIDLTTASYTYSDLYITTVIHDLSPANPNAHITFIENVLDCDELKQKLEGFLKEYGNV